MTQNLLQEFQNLFSSWNISVKYTGLSRNNPNYFASTAFFHQNSHVLSVEGDSNARPHVYTLLFLDM